MQARHRELFVETYERLKRIGRRHRARSDGETLCTTALVHELYLQLSRNEIAHFDDPRSFFAYAARAMRHLLIDAARRRGRVKAGGGAVHVELGSDSQEPVGPDSEMLLAMDHAIDLLQRCDARAAEVLELHYFAGLPMEQVAELLGLSTRTVDRDWRFARAFLHRSLQP